MNIEFFGQNALVEAEDLVFSFEVTDDPRELHSSKSKDEGSLDWSNGINNYHIDDWRILPFGDDNNLPKMIKNVVQNNSRVPGIMKKKIGMLWGKGPKLYKEKFDEEGQLKRIWLDDPEIQAWLNTWDYEDYIYRCDTDANYMQGAFTKMYRNLGSRVGGKSKIAKLEHINPDIARLAARFTANDIRPTHVILNDWFLTHVDHLTKFKVYKLFDFKNPFEMPNSVYYSNLYSFCTDYYTVPDIYGSLEWIRRSTAVPLILKVLSKQAITAKYHITSPQSFWDKAEEQLMKKCNDNKIDYKTSMLRDYRTKFLRKISQVLSGESNTGKYWHSVKTLNVDGTNIIEEGWEIKAIDQNMKEFVETQIKIHETADQAASGSVGVHTSISGTGKSGTGDSGAEQLYALQGYLQTGIDVLEMIVMKPMNYALRANFPEKNIRMGFYHYQPQREQDTSERDRLKNQPV